MTAAECLERYGVVPADGDLPVIRDLLAEEARLERAGKDREEDLALLCAVQLFSRGLVDDVLKIWEARRSGFDLASYLDVQLLCGPGLEHTKAYLTSLGSLSATEALAYIQKCEASGDFLGFTPEDHLNHYRQYFSGE